MPFEKRDFEGFHQVREFVEDDSQGDLFGSKKMVPVSDWRFIIYGFGENDCSVHMTDGSLQRVPIDQKGRITILGKKYSHDYWDH